MMATFAVYQNSSKKSHRNAKSYYFSRTCKCLLKFLFQSRLDDNFPTFERFRNSLMLNCEGGDAGILEVTPNITWPDVVYYQVRHLLPNAARRLKFRNKNHIILRKLSKYSVSVNNNDFRWIIDMNFKKHYLLCLSKRKPTLLGP
jgi:hypothetical protein